MPHARNTDPATSHEAAASITLEHLTKTKRAILAILTIPMTDDHLQDAYNIAVRKGIAPPASQSGIRSRRNELTQEGLIEPIGHLVKTTGRRAIIWTTKKDN